MTATAGAAVVLVDERDDFDPDPRGVYLQREMAAAEADARRELGIPRSSRDPWEDEYVVTTRGIAQIRWARQRVLADRVLTAERAAELLRDEDFAPVLESLLEETGGVLPPDAVLVAAHYDRLIAIYGERRQAAALGVLEQRQRPARTRVSPPRLVFVTDHVRPRVRETRRRRGTRASPASAGRPDDDDDDHDLDAGGRG